MKVLVTSVVKNDHISKNICRLSVEFDLEIKPGQFFMLKTTDDAFLLPRPLSVNDVNGNIVSFLYRIEGKGTKTISSLHENDKIQVFGPLGKGFDISNLKGKTAVIGGGIGVAPLLYLCKVLGKKADVYLGYKDSENTCVVIRFLAFFVRPLILLSNVSIAPDFSRIPPKESPKKPKDTVHIIYCIPPLLRSLLTASTPTSITNP